ncbi:heat-inducible transcription repressor HrcA [Gracilibacillus boraciitolerans JCM 21714]|uniref:Heat-inducible transcription repressor HrcA n=1 Tax=Gracilibacillus boraciitolerans JCM 21714 TaxID=1298598 RepID=W4VCI3_9BACI|nr:heat-inducible transcriptional repressor HrcA [Gracilibacillus boraciitolerans]GAE91135.1 heat-inducible transcription repressor HrcA [Gracilibacillus boraciitolerans JCM 21714]
MLTERQILVLVVIIDEFIQTAQPIGSRAIAKKAEITFSPATIRNEMADLEELGYIEKTHTSSGRVPSEKGYRFYVDHLMSPFRLSKQDMLTIQQTFQKEMIEFELLVQKSARVLSDITNYTSIILGPEVFETTLKQIQIISLSDHTAVAILVTSTGHVEHRHFNVPPTMQTSDLEKLINILNDRLVGVPIVQLQQKLYGEVSQLLQRYSSDFQTTYSFLKDALLDKQPVKLYMDGKTNIMLQPEFNDIHKIQSLYTVMEKEDKMANILRTSGKGIKVSIGQENELDEMQDCSLITATYTLGGEKQLGTIALLGPTRMEYSKVVTLLNILSQRLTDTFHSWR